MKKEDILKVFADNGVEIPEDKQSAVLGELNRLSGVDVTNAKKDYEAVNAELEKYKNGEYVEKAEFEKLKQNQDANAIDVKELEELRKFKTDTEAKATESARKDNIIKALDGKFDKNAIDLIYLAAKDEAKFKDDNTLDDEENFIKGLEDKYSSFKVKETVVGAIPSVINDAKIEKQPETLADAIKDYYKK